MLRTQVGLASRVSGALALSVLLSACGSAAVPGEKLTDARATIRAAEEVGAQNTPQASLHLKLARDQLARAERLIEDGDSDEAVLLLNQAEADADLAVALAHESRTKQRAEQARTRVEQLREQSRVH